MPDDKPPEVGRLRHRVRLQARPGSGPYPLPGGDEDDDWDEAGTYWAEVMPLSGRELMVAAQAIATASHRVTMRAVRPIEPLRHRFVYRGTVLYPESVVRVGGRNEWLLILASYRQGEVPPP